MGGGGKKGFDVYGEAGVAGSRRAKGNAGELKATPAQGGKKDRNCTSSKVNAPWKACQGRGKAERAKDPHCRGEGIEKKRSGGKI